MKDEAKFIRSELHTRASEELEEEVEKELSISDPTEARIVELSGKGKLIAKLVSRAQ